MKQISSVTFLVREVSGIEFDIDDNERTIPMAAISMVVDGLDFAPNTVIDGWALLTASTGPASLFTCSCSVPECAGFWEYEQWQFSPNWVRLRIHPENQKAINKELPKKADWYFSRSQFEAAMFQLEKDLCAFELTKGIAIPLQPSVYISEDRPSLAYLMSIRKSIIWKRIRSKYKGHMRVTRFKKRKMAR